MKKSIVCTISAVIAIFSLSADARKYTAGALSKVSHYLESAEIDRAVNDLGALESQSELIEAELQQNRALRSQLSMTPAADSVDRRINHLVARSLANNVRIGETVATVDRLAEPAREVVNQRTEKLGYLPENTTVVNIQEQVQSQHEIHEVNAEPTVQPKTEPVRVRAAKPVTTTSNCNKSVVYVYQVKTAPAKHRSGCN